jgi:HK97 family phage prohead protease
MTTQIERRTFATKVELRADEARGGHKIAGHSPVWNRLSQNLGGFVERIAPEAVDVSLVEGDIRGLLNHDPSLLLGRRNPHSTAAPTMRLTKDDIGLEFEIDLPDTTVGRDLVVSMERGDIDGSSFSFRAINDEWGFTDDDFPVRTVRAMKMYDVGPVVFPAYSDSEAGMRSEQRSFVFGGLAQQTGLDLNLILEAAEAGQLRDLMTATNQTEEVLRETRADSDAGWIAHARENLNGFAPGK